MNTNEIDHDQTDDEAIFDDVSDEVLEAASGIERGEKAPVCITTIIWGICNC